MNPSLFNNSIEKNENINKYKKHMIDADGTDNIIKKKILNILEKTGLINDNGKVAKRLTSPNTIGTTLTS